MAAKSAAPPLSVSEAKSHLTDFYLSIWGQNIYDSLQQAPPSVHHRALLAKLVSSALGWNVNGRRWQPRTRDETERVLVALENDLVAHGVVKTRTTPAGTATAAKVNYERIRGQDLLAVADIVARHGGVNGWVRAVATPHMD